MPSPASAEGMGKNYPNAEFMLINPETGYNLITQT
jgi:hypothetical protein